MGDSSTEMVLGFAFSANKNYVALINKKRPKWQNGLLNGIGGHVENGETAPDAMVREFKEETGVTILEWIHFGTMKFAGDTVFLFAAFPETEIVNITTQTDEEVTAVSVKNLPDHVIPNLHWLIPMAMWCESEPAYKVISYDEQKG